MDQKSRNFVRKAVKIHNNYCDYSEVRYIDARTKIKIICPIHGAFFQIPRKHLKTKAGGCPKCSRASANNYRKYSIEQFIKKAQLIHGQYNYDLVVFDKITDKIEIICPIHGSFKQSACSHLQGHGCPDCCNRSSRISEGHRYNTQWFINRAIDVHGDIYDYNNTEYLKSNKPVTIICKDHGEFTQIARDHLAGYGCPECGVEKLRSENQMNIDDFISAANECHLSRYDYSLVNIINNSVKVKIRCPDHGVFEQTPKHHLRGQGCPKCRLSSIQLKIIRIFEDLDIPVCINDRHVIEPLEIDILASNFGVEVHGLYWHSCGSVESRDEIYRHYDKAVLCDAAGIDLLQFYEHEILDKFDIIKSMILHRLGRSRHVFARDTNFSLVSHDVATKFFDDNHIQGNRFGDAYGLFDGDKLVMAANFAKHGEGYELIRMCSLRGYVVVGGLSKLISNWAKIRRPKFLLTYADRRFSNGKSYINCGFELIKATKPGYKWVDGLKVYSRHQFQKHKLKDKLQNYNKKLSESRNMFINGYRRLWDAGHWKLIKRFGVFE